MKTNMLNYCLCTEATDVTFPYLRVMLKSFTANNSWFTGDIVILVNDLTPFSEENRSIVTSMYPNVIFKRTDHIIYDNILMSSRHKKNNETQTYIHTLYSIDAFTLSEYDFVLYISHTSLILKDISNIFSTDADLVSTINSYEFPISVGARKTDKQYVINSGIMLISNNILKSGISSDIKLQASKLNNISHVTMHTLISTAISKSEFKLKLLNSVMYAKKSCFPDSKHRTLSLYSSKIYAIDLDVEMFNKVKNISILRFKSINKLWMRYNVSLDAYYNPEPNTVNDKRIQLSEYIRAVKKRTPLKADAHIKTKIKSKPINIEGLDKVERVIVIGSSSSILDSKYGSMIDEFDIIVRVNDFRIYGYEEYVGTKTDYVITSFATNFNTLEYDTINPNQVVMGLANKYNDPAFLHKRIKRFNINDIHILPEYYYLPFSKEIKSSKSCSAGTVAIKWAIDTFKDSDIYVHGIDLDVNKNHYFKQTNNYVKKWKKSVEQYHDFKIERNYISKLTTAGIISKLKNIDIDE